MKIIYYIKKFWRKFLNLMQIKHRRKLHTLETLLFYYLFFIQVSQLETYNDSWKYLRVTLQENSSNSKIMILMKVYML